MYYSHLCVCVWGGGRSVLINVALIVYQCLCVALCCGRFVPILVRVVYALFCSHSHLSMKSLHSRLATNGVHTVTAIHIHIADLDNDCQKVFIFFSLLFILLSNAIFIKHTHFQSVSVVCCMVVRCLTPFAQASSEKYIISGSFTRQFSYTFRSMSAPANTQIYLYSYSTMHRHDKSLYKRWIDEG